MTILELFSPPLLFFLGGIRGLSVYTAHCISTKDITNNFDVNKYSLTFAVLKSRTYLYTMYLDLDKKKEIFATYGGNEANTGLSESQIALFTYRINHLTEHLKKNKKDFGTQRSLLKLVGKRRKLLNYLMKNDIFRYRDIIAKLGIRK